MVCFIFGAVLIVWYVLFLELPYHENRSRNKTYHSMRTVPKNKTYHNMRTAPKTKHTIPYHTTRTVPVLFLELFSWYGMLCFWSCSHGMVCFVFGDVFMVWYVLFLELFSWYMFCFWSCSHGMVCFNFGAVLMVWYVVFLKLFDGMELQKQNIPYHEDSSKNKTYHTMRTVPKTKQTIP
jgi:hypothetical protein